RSAAREYPENHSWAGFSALVLEALPKLNMSLVVKERNDEFNQNMARDGQLSHNVVELDAEIQA
ncbi:hypothetical protein LTR17_027893, partial [Elasticomyces elasticus]